MISRRLNGWWCKACAIETPSVGPRTWSAAARLGSTRKSACAVSHYSSVAYDLPPVLRTVKDWVLSYTYFTLQHIHNTRQTLKKHPKHGSPLF